MNRKSIHLRKVSASSMLEVVVALVLVMLVFGVAMTLFTNVLRSSNNMQQLNGGLILKTIYLETIDKKTFYDEEIHSGENIIHKKVSKYKNLSTLQLIELEMEDPLKRKLISRKDIVLVETDE